MRGAELVAPLPGSAGADVQERCCDWGGMGLGGERRECGGGCVTESGDKSGSRWQGEMNEQAHLYSLQG